MHGPWRRRHAQKSLARRSVSRWMVFGSEKILCWVNSWSMSQRAQARAQRWRPQPGPPIYLRSCTPTRHGANTVTSSACTGYPRTQSDAVACNHSWESTVGQQITISLRNRIPPCGGAEGFEMDAKNGLQLLANHTRPGKQTPACSPIHPICRAHADPRPLAAPLRMEDGLSDCKMESAPMHAPAGRGRRARPGSRKD